MFELFIATVLQLATLTGNAPTNQIGGSGWDNDITTTQTTPIGGSGWDNDGIGGSGWDNDAIGGSGWDND